MDSNAKTTGEADKLNGLFVRGVVLSSTAKMFKRKDGSGNCVCVRHEIALQPGLAVWEEYPDVNSDKVKIEGDQVVDFPRLPALKPIELKVIRWQERDKFLLIREALFMT